MMIQGCYPKRDCGGYTTKGWVASAGPVVQISDGTAIPKIREERNQFVS
jgi:hypothetical protein